MSAARPEPAGQNACVHCGLPVPAARRGTGGAERFCCRGCEVVYRTIRDHGLDRYYALRAEQASRPALPASESDFTTFDHPAFSEAYVRRDPRGLSRITLLLEGVHCAACVWLVERLPRLLPGVVSARLDVRRQTVEVVWDGQVLPLSRIARELDRLGYPPHPYRPGREAALKRRERRRRLVDLGIAGACAANAMGIAFALYGGMLSGIDPRLRLLFRSGALLVTLVALLGPGRVFFRGALASLRSGIAHMDLPVAIALGAGTLWGALNTFRDTGEVYFESLTAVVFLLLVGRFVQQGQQSAARDAVSLLYRLTPGHARLAGGTGGTREVPVEALRPGMRIEVRAGETVPADGRIVRGSASVDLSLLTGESRPVTRREGDLLHAGTVNRGTPVLLQVTAAGSETRVGRLMRLVEALAAERPPVVRLADRFAHRFVLAVLAAAAATFLIWLRADPARALEHTVALLIVTCPCALGLATPLAVVAAIGRAARAGILVKGGAALEALARPGLLLLDKTGTLTVGRMQVVRWHGDATVRAALAAVEAEVAHPIARALAECAGEAGRAARATGVRLLAGRGVAGEVLSPDGRARAVVAGSPDLVRSRVRVWPGWAERAVASCLAERLTPVAAAVDGRVAAVTGLGDPLRPEARATLAALAEEGWEIELLSGDHPKLVEATAEALGLSPSRALGGVSPERKAEIVRKARRRGRPVVMVGDGVNDAAALGAATVGIAAHGSAEASLEVADVALQRPGLDTLRLATRGARRTLAAIRRNLWISAGYNLLAGGLAMAGRIDPMLAAVLMPLSSLTVVSLSFRARTFGAGRRGR